MRGGATLNFSHLSPDKHWKCDEWSYFLSGDQHLCFSEIKASHRDEDYKMILEGYDYYQDSLNFVWLTNLWQNNSFPYYRYVNSNKIEILRKDDIRIPFVFMNLYDFFETTGDAEFLYFWLADDDLQLKIDNKLIFQSIKNAAALFMKPLALSGDHHIIEAGYSDSIGGYWYIYSQIIWPFPKGTLFNSDWSQKTYDEIMNYLKSEWEITTWGMNIPKKRADNIVRSVTEMLNSEKSDQLLSETPNSPGYFCPGGQKLFFAHNEDGSYQKVPLCYANIKPAKPNPYVDFKNLPQIFTGEHMRRKATDADGVRPEDIGRPIANVFSFSGICHAGAGDLTLKYVNDGYAPIWHPTCTNDQWSEVPWTIESFPEGKNEFRIEQSILYSGELIKSFSTGYIYKDTIWPEITFDRITPELAREKTLSGSINETGASLIGYKLTDTVNSCEEQDYEVLPEWSTGYTITFKSESDNGKKICLKARDELGNFSYNSETIQGIWTKSIIINQLPPLVSRKENPVKLDDVTVKYVGGQDKVFNGTLIHNAQEQGLDTQNPSKWNYVITYVASDGGKSADTTALRVVEITDADPLKEQIKIWSDPQTIRRKTQDSIDYMLKVKSEVEKIFKNPTATQIELDKATSDLADAIKKLKNKPKREEVSGISSLLKEQHKKSDTIEIIDLDPEHHSAQTTGEIFTEDQIFNPTIFDGQCYNRRPLQEIKNSLTLKTSEEFKKSQSFLRSYEMTRYDSIDRFRPKDDLTREEAAKIFSNFAINVLCRKPDMNLKINYRDLENANITLKQYITIAYQLGIMKGAHGNFRPKDKITKKEISATIIRMILKSYLDETKTSTKTRYSEYEKVAKELWILKKDVNDDPLLREYTALMLFRAYKNQPFSWKKLGYETFALKYRDRFVK